MTAKVWRCIGWEFQEDGKVELTLREESSAAYTDPAVAEYGSLVTVTPTSNVDAQYRPARFRIPTDPWFQYSTDQLHWYLYRPGGGTPTGISIVGSGGVLGGVLELTGDSTNKVAMALPAVEFEAITGQKFRATLRWRRTSSLTGTDSISYWMLLKSAGAAFASSKEANPALVTISGINAATVNEWQESSQEFTLENVAKNLGQLPYATCLVQMTSAVTGGVVQIDSFDCVLIG